MKKTKNKNKKNKAAKKATLLSGAGKSLKKLGKGTSKGLGRLSTTQKVLAGTTLGVLGISYLAKQLKKGRATAAETPGADDAAHAEHNLTTLDGQEA